MVLLNVESVESDEMKAEARHNPESWENLSTTVSRSIAFF